MAFRFFRRIKIAPGLTLNLSKSGASLSAGVRGARVTAGPRGVRRTVGIPGSGVHWTEEKRWGGEGGGRAGPHHGGARRGGARRIPHAKEDLTEAELRRAMESPQIELVNPRSNRRYGRRSLELELERREKRRERARVEAEVEKENRAYREVLEHWKALPRIPTLEEFRAYRRPRSFRPLPPPEAPDYEEERERLFRELASEQSEEFPYSILPGFFALRRASELLDQRWPEQLERIQDAYERRIAEHEERNRETRAAHRERESARVGRLERILRDDPRASTELAAAVFENIDWPFATDAGIATHDGAHLYVNLDLPEIDDVIRSETPYVGRGDVVRGRRRTKRARRDDYFQLVVGQAVHLATHQFAWNPTLERVVVAGFTQRTRKRPEDPAAPYVFEISFTQELLRNFSPEEENLETLLARAGARIDRDHRGVLRPIAPPRWMEPEAGRTGDE